MVNIFSLGEMSETSDMSETHHSCGFAVRTFSKQTSETSGDILDAPDVSDMSGQNVRAVNSRHAVLPDVSDVSDVWS